MSFLKKIILPSFLCFTTFLNANVSTEKSAFSQSTIEKKESTSEYLKKYLRSKKLVSLLSRGYTKKYYRNSSYELFWSDESGIKQITYDLLNAIHNDPILKPYVNKLFKLEKINSYLENKNTLDNESLVKLDILLTGNYYFYMKYLSKGFIDWEKFQEELKKLNEEDEIIANWQKYDVRKNIRELLYKAIEKNDIYEAINAVNYTFRNVKKLEEKLLELELLSSNSGYTKIPKLNRSLRKGKEYDQIPFLRQRLLESFDLESNLCEKEKLTNDNEVSVFQENTTLKEKAQINCKNFYDEELFLAVKNFQKRYGLEDDGIVGKNTIKKLNEPVEEKINRIRINLERMRWMPRTFGKKHLVVNIPDFNLKFYEEDEKKLEMAVIVGLPKHPTPIFSHRMSEIVLNPYWRIPQRIVKNEIIPELIKDANYLVQNDINVYENWDHESMQYDVSAVEWDMYQDNDLIGTSKEAPMRFIQIPGAKNPLGKIKFLFPNKYSVYMHDTPFKDLFNEHTRAFSHGCIRLSDSNKLFETIALDEEKIDFNEANEVLKEKDREELTLDKKIPVHIIYLTSWIDDEGKLQHRDDLYNYDKMQGDILFSPSF